MSPALEGRSFETNTGPLPTPVCGPREVRLAQFSLGEPGTSTGSFDALDDIVGRGGVQRCLEILQSTLTFAPGEVVAGRYEIERALAKGGMGEVYVAFDKVLGRRLALKTVTSTLSDDRRANRRLCREAQLASCICHPNVCRVYDVGVHGDDPRDVIYFMTMELVEGLSVAQARE